MAFCRNAEQPFRKCAVVHKVGWGDRGGLDNASAPVKESQIEKYDFSTSSIQKLLINMVKTSDQFHGLPAGVVVVVVW